MAIGYEGRWPKVSPEAVAGFVGGLVGAVAALVAAGWTLWIEGRRRREDARREMEFRRDQYFVESSADISDRVWAFVHKLETMEAKERLGWEPIYGVAKQLRNELDARRPRYRLAGIEPAAKGIIELLGGFISTQAAPDGYTGDQDEFKRLLEEFGEATDGHSPDSTQVAMRRYKAQIYEQLNERVGAALTAIADYDHGGPFQLSEASEPWASFFEILERVQAENHKPSGSSRPYAGPADEPV